MKTWMHYFVDFGPWGGGSTSIHFCVVAPFRAHAQTLSKKQKKLHLDRIPRSKRLKLRQMKQASMGVFKKKRKFPRLDGLICWTEGYKIG